MTSMDRDLGRLEGKVDAQGEQMGHIIDKLDKLMSGECATGKENKGEIIKLVRRVGKVEYTLAKAIAIGVLVAGGGHGAAEIIRSVW